AENDAALRGTDGWPAAEQGGAGGTAGARSAAVSVQPGAVAAADGAAVVVAVAGPAGPVAESRQVVPGELVADCLVHHRLHAAGRAAGSQRHGSRAGPRGSLHWRAVRLSRPRTGFIGRLRDGLQYRCGGD